MEATISDLKQLHWNITTKGWIHLTHQSEQELKDVLSSLGEVIFTTDVVIKPESKSLVTSAHGLHLHTDHPKAEYIAWHCIKQSDEGGDTILLDVEKLYNQLNEEEQRFLQSIDLYEHKVFAGDKDFYPMVSIEEGKPKFYFSFWLVREGDKENPALKHFQKLISQSEPIRINLKPGDMLIVDNRRVLHGRTPIAGTQDRHLQRYWISTDTFHKQTKSSSMTTAALTVPNPITAERIDILFQKRIDRDIASIDLEMVKMKLRELHEGIGWTAEQVEDAEIEYKRYLHLTRHFPYPNYSIVPNKIMDTMWHYHILDTRAYHRDCERVFGHYLHHFPYFGLRGDDDAQNLHAQFEKTKEYYLQTFGEDMARNKEADCWHDCEDRCWHACDNRQ
jgi:alpha-ketoglutarate-dependent taurine dioxygenase